MGARHSGSHRHAHGFSGGAPTLDHRLTRSGSVAKAAPPPRQSGLYGTCHTSTTARLERDKSGNFYRYTPAHRVAGLRVSTVTRAAVLLVLLAVASGCSSIPAPDSNTATEPITPAPVPETDSSGYPDWAPTGDVNVTALLNRHDRALTDGYTARIVWNRTVEERDLDIRRLTVRSTLWMGTDRYRLRTAAAIHRDTASYTINPASAIALRLGDGTDVYAVDSTEFVRRDEGAVYEQRVANRTRYQAEFRATLTDLLRVSTTRVEPVTRNGATWYRVEGSGQAGDGLVSDYRLRALVSPDGVISKVEVDYLLGRSTVSIRVEVTPGATFDPPGWLPEARMAAANSTATGVGS